MAFDAPGDDSAGNVHTHEEKGRGLHPGRAPEAAAAVAVAESRLPQSSAVLTEKDPVSCHWRPPGTAHLPLATFAAFG